MVTLKKNIGFIITLCLLITGCDPIQSKMDFHNKATDAHFFQTFFVEEETSTYMVETLLTKVNADKTKRTISVVDMKTIFNMHDNSLLNVVVFKDYDFLKENSKIIKNSKSDSLLSVGDYMVKKYSYAQLEKKDWLVTYPDDGFKQGKPLNFNKNQNPKLTPSSEILKEKGIEDRWSKKDSL